MKKAISKFFQHKHFDKVMHFAAGAGVAMLVITAGGPEWAAFLASFAAGIGKEVYDKRTHGKPDGLDAFATIAGGAVYLAALTFLP